MAQKSQRESDIDDEIDQLAQEHPNLDKVRVKEWYNMGYTLKQIISSLQLGEWDYGAVYEIIIAVLCILLICFYIIFCKQYKQFEIYKFLY